MVDRLILAYDGRRFAGWQHQTNAVAIQQVVEEAMADLFGQAVRIHGAGRTDAGVHARGQVAHFIPPRHLPPKALVHAINHRLPPDIRVMAADRMPEDFHARKSALAKLYTYRLYAGRVLPPWIARRAMRVRRDIDSDRIRQALASLPGRHDFSAFALAGGSHGQPVRRIFAATVDAGLGSDGREIVLRFWGEGFLRGMVRSLAGTLVQIGLGERPAEDMQRLLQPGHRRSEAGPTAEACGLCLETVFYPSRWVPSETYSA